jgi:LysM repeat protein
MKQVLTIALLFLIWGEASAQKKLLERGFGSAIASSQSDKLVALHRTYPIGTRILVKNTANEGTVVVKIIGVIPNIAENEKIVIKLSQAACKVINASGKRFSVELYTAPPEGESWETPKDTTKVPKPKEKEPDTTDDKLLIHKVNAGETLYAIARKYKITVENIMEWNKLENTTVYKGQKLKIMKKF